MGILFDCCYQQETDEDEYGRLEDLETLQDGERLKDLALEKLERFKTIRGMVGRKFARLKVRFETMDNLRGRYNGRTQTISLHRRYKGYSVSVGILVHELIHAIGGTELDAEFFENECCSFEEGARHPTRGDFNLFVRFGSRFVRFEWIKRYSEIEAKYKGRVQSFRKRSRQ